MRTIIICSAASAATATSTLLTSEPGSWPFLLALLTLCGSAAMSVMVNQSIRALER